MRSCVPLLLSLIVARTSCGQAYGVADTDQPGDVLIQTYLAEKAQQIHETFDASIASSEQWNTRRDEYLQEYFYMLGLSPLPERTPLQPQITGTYKGDTYLVDMLHFQSRPGLYVTGNLYRPKIVAAGAKLPAILYVCGHAGRGRNGNKAAFQSHGIWFARHGYICLIIDTLQLGEIASFHHGTYREQRWWWHSRGYTPAGVECWNGIRAIDYLTSRSDVDANRIGVTGISGGGAATFWITAADSRVRAAAPVSGMADLPSYVTNRVINGHCDCMFMTNTFQWPWARIAALIAPRPLLFVNSDADNIFPMDANERIINRLERVYKLYGAGDQVDAFVSIGGHDYRADIHRAVYRFFNTHLKGDPAPVTDSEVDLVTGQEDSDHPIAPAKLRVFPEDKDLPQDSINRTIDETFVPMSTVALPQADSFPSWRENLVRELRRVSLRDLHESVPAARIVEEQRDELVVETEPNIRVRLRLPDIKTERPIRVHIVSGELDNAISNADAVLYVRGTHNSAWTRKNPPNYVERCHALLGRTVDTGRVWDIIACWKLLQTRVGDKTAMTAVGKGDAGILLAYAALLVPDIERVEIAQPMRSHMDTGAPQLLNVLRVCDISETLGMLAPRHLTLVNSPDELASRVRAIYAAAGGADSLEVRSVPE